VVRLILLLFTIFNIDRTSDTSLRSHHHSRQNYLKTYFTPNLSASLPNYQLKTASTQLHQHP